MGLYRGPKIAKETKQENHNRVHSTKQRCGHRLLFESDFVNSHKLSIFVDHSIRVLIENGTGGWYGGGTERFYNQRLSLDASLDGNDHALTWISHYLSMEAVWIHN